MAKTTAERLTAENAALKVRLAEAEGAAASDRAALASSVQQVAASQRENQALHTLLGQTQQAHFNAEQVVAELRGGLKALLAALGTMISIEQPAAPQADASVEAEAE